jgi:hypothetical protein
MNNIFWYPGMLDVMGRPDVEARLNYLDQQAVTLEMMAAQMRIERAKLLAAACKHELHRSWAMSKDNFEAVIGPLSPYNGRPR